MELTGTRLIAADRATVWAALNNPETLKACIPGCQELSGSADEGFEATVVQKVGPVKATFKGAVTLEDVNAPESYRIVGEGKGGAAGFAKGQAAVALSETAEGTELAYTVDAKVGGKLAQIGSRLIDGTARKLSGEFFETFSVLAADGQSVPSPAVEAAPAPAAAPEKSAPAATAEDEARGGGLPTWVWICGAIVVLAVVYMYL
jgi:carbon monoxide dehydrogenase subunit G